MHFFPSLYLFFCCPLLLKWDGTTNDNLALPSGKVRAATLSFHSFCPGAPLSVPSKMPESTCINEVSGTDPEELQGG